MSFFEETVIDERGIRRLAQSRGCDVSKSGDTYSCCGVDGLTDDEVWAVLSECPQVETLGGKGRPVA